MGVGVKEGGSAGLRLGVAVAVLLAGYLGLAWFLGRHVPANTSVAGVPIGGMAPASAERTLQRALAPKEKAKLTLSAGDKSVQLDPAAAGLRFDLAGTVDGLSGFSLKPADLWDRLTGGQEEQLKTSVDRQQLENAVKGVQPRLETQAVQGGITFPSGKVSVVRPVVGQKLSVRL